MAYTKHTWQRGDVITSAKLNEMENGIAAASAIVFITATWDDDLNGYVLNATFTEIENYFNNDVLILVKMIAIGTDTYEITDINFVSSVGENENPTEYYVGVTPFNPNGGETIWFIAETSNGIPLYQPNSI